MLVVGREYQCTSCPDCGGHGYVYLADEAEHVDAEDCETCDGKGYIDGEEN